MRMAHPELTTNDADATQGNDAFNFTDALISHHAAHSKGVISLGLCFCAHNSPYIHMDALRSSTLQIQFIGLGVKMIAKKTWLINRIMVADIHGNDFAILNQ